MKISREEKKIEAIKRMKKLDVISDAIKQFADSDTIMVCEPPLGGLYWLNDEEKEMVHKFEEENNALVYMVIRAFTNYGKMDSMLYVSDYKEEWAMDNEDLDYDIAMTYTINHDYEFGSEFGSIGIKRIHGGVLRKFN